MRYEPVFLSQVIVPEASPSRWGVRRMRKEGWHGEPLAVVLDEGGRAWALNGQRRVAEAHLAGLSEVPAVVLEGEDDEARWRGALPLDEILSRLVA